jgi:hypothetical protein
VDDGKTRTTSVYDDQGHGQTVVIESQDNPDGSHTTETRVYDGNDVYYINTSTTSADEKTTVTKEEDRNNDGRWSTMTITTVDNGDGTTSVTTDTDDGHGNTTHEESTVMGSKPTSDPDSDETTGREISPIDMRTVIEGVARQPNWPSSEWGTEGRSIADRTREQFQGVIPGAALAPTPGDWGAEGQPIAERMRERLHGLVYDVAAARPGTGWLDPAWEEPPRPPDMDVAVASTRRSEDEGWGGYIPPQAVVGRASAAIGQVPGVRVAGTRLALLAAALTRSTI